MRSTRIRFAIVSPVVMIILLLSITQHFFKLIMIGKTTFTTYSEIEKRSNVKLYNLMEEKFGHKWSSQSDEHFSPQNCNIENANENRLQQDHPCVIYLIRHKYLEKPASKDSAYRLNDPSFSTNPSDGQSLAILRLLRNQTNGFFIECGSFDGEYLSNTLFMERSLNWSGLLIEADKKAFSQLLTRNRKAYASPVCLSTEPFPMEVLFNATLGAFSSIIDHDKRKMPHTKENNLVAPISSKDIASVYKVQCFPLYSILLAVGRTDIDYFSLDVEGAEYKILQWIPWRKVDIKTLTVEWNHVPEGEVAITRLMESSGFVKFGQISMGYSHEVVYVKDFLEDLRQFYD